MNTSVYLQYNLWANTIVAELIKSLSDEQVHAKQTGSFDSIYKTLCHIWDAQVIWLCRWSSRSFQRPSELSTGTTAEALNGYIQSSEDIFAFYKQTQHPADLVISYSDLKGNTHNNTLNDMADHVCNHSTFHRGQLINFLRGFEPVQIPSTDYITFIRQNS